MSLEYAAMFWLWIDKKCHYILEQRSPVYCMGLPDVMGVTEGRRLIEIEIKHSASDFAADFKKIHRINQANNKTLAPYQFYYLMPCELAEKLKEKIPEHAGLMTLNESGYITVLKVAPINKQSPKLTIKQCVRLCRQMTTHMMGYAVAIQSAKSTWRHAGSFSHADWVDAAVGTWEI